MAHQIDDFIWLDDDEDEGSWDELDTGCLGPFDGVIDEPPEDELPAKVPRVFNRGN